MVFPEVQTVHHGGFQGRLIPLATDITGKNEQLRSSANARNQEMTNIGQQS